MTRSLAYPPLTSRPIHCKLGDDAQKPLWLLASLSLPPPACVLSSSLTMTNAIFGSQMYVLTPSSTRFLLTPSKVTEAILCTFQGALASKRVTLVSPTSDEVVPGDFQCRCCFNPKYPLAETPFREKLLHRGCIGENDTCR